MVGAGAPDHDSVATGVIFHAPSGAAKRFSYAELTGLAARAAGKLLAAGLKPGDRVGLIAETTPEFVTTFLGCQMAGLTPAPLPPPPPFGGIGAELERVVRLRELCNLRALVMSDAYVAPYRASGLPCMIWPELAGPGLARPGLEGLDCPAPQAATTVVPPTGAAVVNPDAFIQFTSGSMSEPRGVINSHRAVAANVAAMNAALGVTANDVAVSWLPLHHDMGLVGFLLAPWAAGIDLHLMSPSAFIRRPETFAQLMHAVGGTVAYMPSFAYGLLGRALATGARIARLDLSAWRVAGIGGDQIDPLQMAAFARDAAPAGFHASAFRASYGMAEAVLAVTIVRAGDDAAALTTADGRSLACCGAPVDGIDVEIRAEDGRVVGAGVEGQVWVRGVSIVQRFADGRERPGAWLDTGDLGLMHAGKLFISGRAKSAIKVSGRSIWPQDVEHMLRAEFGYRHGAVAVFSADHFNSGEIVVALKRGDMPDVLKVSVRGMVARHFGVECTIIAVGSGFIPLSTSGKIARNRLKANYQALAAQSQASVQSATQADGGV